MKTIIALFFLLTSGIASAACDRPTAPTLPDGNTASLETMERGQQAVVAYNAAAEAYLACISNEFAPRAETATDAQRVDFIQRQNNVTDEVQAVSDAFNNEVRKFRARPQ
ncbi:MAG: hypothetical protein AAGJ52_09585 [Pseudomonadota bacterium]